MLKIVWAYLQHFSKGGLLGGGIESFAREEGPLSLSQHAPRKKKESDLFCVCFVAFRRVAPHVNLSVEDQEKRTTFEKHILFAEYVHECQNGLSVVCTLIFLFCFVASHRALFTMLARAIVTLA